MSSILRAVSNGATTVYSVPFPYLDKAHVKVYKGNVLQTTPGDYSWLTSSSIELAVSAANGEVVTVKRVTPVTPLTVFTPGNLDTDDLNIGILQPLYIAEEGRDWSELAWVANAGGTSGTITKGVTDEIPGYDSAGNLVPKTTLGAINSAVSAASAAAGSAIAAAASAALALALAAGLTLPALTAADKNKTLRGNTAGTGYELRRNPFYDPYEYGCLGNGGANDTTNLGVCRAAANSNEGIRAAPSGRGVTVIPPGNFLISSIATAAAGEKWMGLGGTLTSSSQTLDLFTVSHDTVIIDGLILVCNPATGGIPLANTSVFHHSAGADCIFEDITTYGGYYGVRGSGGKDSSWINIIVNAPYGSSGYFLGYQGLWVYRAKWDASWPVSQPTSAQIKGAMVNGATYAAGDLVSSGAYWFQCFSGGTAPASGNLTPGLIGAVIGSSGSATWKLGRVAGSANLWVDSGCFIFKFTDCDLSGGHDYNIAFKDTSVTTRPQDMYFKGIETGGALYNAVYAHWVDALQMIGGIAHSLCSSTGVAFALDNVRGATILANNIRGCPKGVVLTSNSKRTWIAGNFFYGATTCVEVGANTKRFNIMGNWCSGDAGLWGLNGTGISIAAGCDYYRVRDNDVADCTVAPVTDLSTPTVGKFIMDGNF